MTVQTWTAIIVTFTFLMYIGIAIWSRARTTGEFYVAGKQVSPLANGLATAADWMSAASFLGMAGAISFMGRDGSVYLMGWTGGYVLLALLLAPYLRKFIKYTVPDFVASVVAFAFGLAASSFFPAIFLGIFSTRVNREGAISGMISGILFTASYIIYFKFINPSANVHSNWLFGISPEGIGTIGMLLNFAVTLGISRVTPAPPQRIKELVLTIRTP